MIKNEELKIRETYFELYRIKPSPLFELYRIKPSPLFELRRLKHGFIPHSISRRRSMLYQRSILCSISPQHGEIVRTSLCLSSIRWLTGLRTSRFKRDIHLHLI